ncbi:ureidoglycolate lyase [Caballeronia sp. INDeC2]|uniref:ureidoglycolate lyase n=1 Tax=Caballeronia sp. INDeC2 TaxID=2921747 RepID=UPI002027AAC1|nr:ureidoglycolate lyase [Caballeronia sp. INDeC2]
MLQHRLQIRPLTDDGFAPFGEVISRDGKQSFRLNEGMAKRFHDLANIDVNRESGRPAVSILHARPNQFPLVIKFVQQFVLSSQAFIPLTESPFITVVAVDKYDGTPGELKAFISDGKQGINYRIGVWHHTLIVPDKDAEFLVIDRAGPGRNCNEFWFDERDRPILTR